MVLFGGRERCGGACSTPFNDVWQLTLAGTPTWTQVFPLGTPPAAGSARGAIYDPIRDRMVILTGNNAWALSLSGTPTWTALNPWGMPHGGSTVDPLLYDPIRDRAVSMSVDGAGNVSTLDFKLDPNQPLWSKNYPTGTPLSRREASPVYDPDDDLVLLFGGVVSSDIRFDTTFRLDFGGGFQLDAGATNGSVTMGKWCWNSGEVATIVAQPNQGYKLGQWLGDASGNDNPLQVTMNGFKVIRPEFVPAVTGVEETPIAFGLSVRPNPSTGPANVE
jgi:hypothetical protein